MAHNIFLSYSRDDTAIMDRLKGDFEQIGFSVWTDENIEPGSPSWKLTIEQAIRDADCMVVIFSPDASESRWVRAELDFAEAQEKPVFSVLARGDSSNAVPLGYSAHQWIDLRKEKDYNVGFTRLAEGIAHKIQITPFGLTILQRNIQPTTTNLGGLPLRFVVPFMVAVIVVGFIGLTTLNNNSTASDDDLTAEVTATILPTETTAPEETETLTPATSTSIPVEQATLADN